MRRNAPPGRRLLLKGALAAGALTALPGAAQAVAPAAVRYTMTAFTNSSESHMYVYESTDATTYTLLKGPAYTPPTGLIRDPSLIRHTDGRYWIVVGAEAGGAEAGGDDGDGLTGGDEFELVLDGFNERAVGRRASVGPGADAPEGVPGRAGSRGRGSSAMSPRVMDSLHDLADGPVLTMT